MKITVNNLDISDRLLEYTLNMEMNEDSLLLGNTICTQVTMKLDNQDGNMNALLDQPFLIYNDNISLTGTFYVYEKPEKYTGELELTLYDAVYHFEQRYDTQLTYPVTINDQLNEMASMTGLTIDKTNLRTATLQKSVDWYDNTVSMRNYLGWIAELDGCNVFASSNGHIIFRPLASGQYDSIDLESYSKGDLVHFSRICFDNGILKLEEGNDTGNTLYLSSNNGYIDSETSLAHIYEMYKNLSFYAIEDIRTDFTSQIETVQKDISTIQSVTNYIRKSADGIEVGASNTDTSTLTAKDGFHIRYKGQDAAVFKMDQLEVANAVHEKSVKIGKMITQATADGEIIDIWVGD